MSSEPWCGQPRMQWLRSDEYGTDRRTPPRWPSVLSDLPVVASTAEARRVRAYDDSVIVLAGHETRLAGFDESPQESE